MTVKQCSEYLSGFNERQKERTKEQAILLNGVAQQIISGVGSMLDKKVKFLTLQKLYPALFKDEKQESQEQTEAKRWLAFLFG